MEATWILTNLAYGGRDVQDEILKSSYEILYNMN
jgi:hypothetical protein